MHKLSFYIFTILILVILLGGCSGNAPRLTEEQVISYVQVHGIPSYYPNEAVSPVGDWSATYEEERTWRIVGSLVWQDHRGNDHYWRSIWVFRNIKDDKWRIELTEVVGEPWGVRW